MWAAKTVPAMTERLRVHEAEEAGEELRLLYVAATRAQCRVVALVGAHRETPGDRRCTGCCSGAWMDRRQPDAETGYAWG